MLDYTFLKTHSTDESYQRGLSLSNDTSINIVEKSPQRFEAILYGTDRYKIVIDVSGRVPHCHCTCPFEYEGYCKHIIAVGLRILNNEIGAYTNHKKSYVLDESHLTTREIWRNMTEAQQLQVIEIFRRDFPDSWKAILLQVRGF